MRFLWLLALPLVWVPLIGVLVVVGPRLPVWAWLVGGALVALLIRRRRAAAAAVASLDPGPVDGPRWGPRGAGF